MMTQTAMKSLNRYQVMSVNQAIFHHMPVWDGCTLQSTLILRLRSGINSTNTLPRTFKTR